MHIYVNKLKIFKAIMISIIEKLLRYIILHSMSINVKSLEINLLTIDNDI